MKSESSNKVGCARNSLLEHGPLAGDSFLICNAGNQDNLGGFPSGGQPVLHEIGFLKREQIATSVKNGSSVLPLNVTTLIVFPKTEKQRAANAPEHRKCGKQRTGSVVNLGFVREWSPRREDSRHRGRSNFNCRHQSDQAVRLPVLRQEFSPRRDE